MDSSSWPVIFTTAHFFSVEHSSALYPVHHQAKPPPTRREASARIDTFPLISSDIFALILSDGPPLTIDLVRQI